MTKAGVDAGLCGTCEHARTVASAKGSTFLRCDLSFVDARYPRYPTLPVVACAGYRRRSGRADAAVSPDLAGRHE